MINPYGANQKNYSTKDFLAVAQDQVRQLENGSARPDIWIVYEYAVTFPAVPEQVDGQPANTTTGFAYWLIHHIDDPVHWP